ncbi:acyltransferase [Hahella sp. KA22]|uniref:1-acyl-sn-glycerol-3-phosphate acyltransferase n=1 Tax=Hahella sp. KA22 TaxID=1628392 RepID=UPI000FDDF715|nr:1-acyl-sn-glycerol-3-phosphate acyltransferase [Hahella sp. KA22]AZZ93585.1 acyltransferase [Hahella sp. KA22]QAY56960.1 acyltransferase [Hahella sp. KA22]
MLYLLSKLLFKFSGWTYDEKPELWEDKQVVIGFPHTTNMDGVRILALFWIYRRKLHTLVKKDLFVWPFSWFLSKFGCIPVDRSSKTNLVDQMRQEFAKRATFTLAIAPEATRNKMKEERKPIRTGFWHIAKAAGAPIILMMSDSKRKRGRILGKIFPSESLLDDLMKIKQIYADQGVEVLIGTT